ncbi:MAG: class I SAM-dependent methyltransferase [Acidobacteriaceae bacterium]|nr:class I SAM-dependent methyltransferase [Acidobacteriaceae bacterium]
MPDDLRSSYDNVAGMYHTLWADWYLPAAMPALNKLFFSQVPTGARVLDLCCGSGHVTKEIAARGYAVTGVDNSAGLIELARRELPHVEFFVQDATHLSLPGKFQAVLCTFDSLNHILTLEDLEQAFAGVYRSLDPGGLFVFDMNLAEAYSADLHQWSVDLQEESAGLVRGKFDPLSKIATTELIWFVKAPATDCWRRHQGTVKQRCYPQAEIVSALARTGFHRIETIAAREVGVTSELGFGRTYFAAYAHE